MKIRIIAERVFGEPDLDQSIEIPKKGELENKLNSIPNENPVVTEFSEHLCRDWQYPAASFPAVSMGNLYMIWVDERKEWVGIKYQFISRDSDGSAPGSGAIWQGYDENILSSGPYALDEKFLEKIFEAYGLTKEDIGLSDVTRNSPAKIILNSILKNFERYSRDRESLRLDGENIVYSYIREDKSPESVGTLHDTKTFKKAAVIELIDKALSSNSRQASVTTECFNESLDETESFYTGIKEGNPSPHTNQTTLELRMPKGIPVLRIPYMGSWEDLKAQFFHYLKKEKGAN